MSETVTIKACQLRPGMVLTHNREVVDVKPAVQRFNLTIFTDRGFAPRNAQSFEVHQSERVVVTLDSYRAHCRDQFPR